MPKIGIIGGSGLEDPDILRNPENIFIQTPYGESSSSLLKGTVSGTEVVLLSRHGRSHTITPTMVNNRANIFSLKEAGCTHIIATTACGSLREEIRRGDLVVPDQFIDFTRRRPLTFFDEFEPGKMKHTPMADPFDKHLREIIIRSAVSEGINIHEQGTVITIEGPRFSTRAESKMFRAWGADLVNMSIAPEAILANEIGIPYAIIAMSTDYDSWKEDEEPVSWEDVLHVFSKNVNKVLQLLLKVIPSIPD
ncbi:MAG TPA: S-methyl-5'-thioadenosine phosphorylase [Bacteroidales bacterium]|nr:S-methyl-5'-thioadenosine phosphorylase [Bacteroidales bacterium]